MTKLKNPPRAQAPTLKPYVKANQPEVKDYERPADVEVVKKDKSQSDV